MDAIREHRSALPAIKLAAPSRARGSAPAREQAASAKHRVTSFPAWREWFWFALQVCLVVGIELSDDTIRGFFALRPIAPTQVNAVRVMEFEQSHDLWIEPGLQRFLEQTHHLLGLTVSWGQVFPVANAWYGLLHGLVTVVVAAWIFWRRRWLFPFVRNVFLFATALSVAIYNIFPGAPPRLATGLRYEGHPFRFIDTVFEGSGINLSFDQYAAMPSLHIAWALIVGLALAWTARPLVVRLLGLSHPVLMSVAVIVTGNHYVADCLGAAAVVVVAFCLALLVSQRKQEPHAGRAERDRDVLPYQADEARSA